LREELGERSWERGTGREELPGPDRLGSDVFGCDLVKREDRCA